MKHIHVHNLTKTFRSRGNKHLIGGIFDPRWKYKHAVDNISFDIEAGEAVAFLGPNGAGKTTTTKVLTGLIAPNEGFVSVLDYTPFDKKEVFLRQIGLVMGNKAGLNWDLTAHQAFELLAKIYSIPEATYKKRVNELAELLAVSHVLGTQIRRTSLGERMKLELIGALLHDPKVLFLDEPTIGLDIPSKLAMRAFLQKINKEQGKTIILTSHDMDDVADLCERVLVINKGKLVVDEPMKELTSRYTDYRNVVVTFEGDVSSIKLGKDVVISKVSPSQITLTTSRERLFAVLELLNKQVTVLDLAIEQIPLETIIADQFEK